MARCTEVGLDGRTGAVSHELRGLNVSLFENNQMFLSVFDLRVVGVVVYFPDESWRPASKGSLASGTPGILVDVDGSPIHLLLGRNGSGKSLLLESLESLNEDKVGYPSTSVLFSIPEEDSFARWERACNELLDAEWYRHIEEQNAEEFGMQAYLTFHEAVGLDFAEYFCLGLIDSVPGDHLTWNFPMSKVEVLRHFGLGHLVGRFADRQSRRDYPYGLWIEVDPRLHAESFLVSAYAEGMTMWKHNALGEPISIESWFGDQSRSLLVGAAVEQFFAAVTHIERFDNGSFRLIAEVPDGGALAEFLSLTDEECRQATDDAETRGWWPPRRSFPHLLFDRVTIGNRQRIASRVVTTDASAFHDLISVSNVSPDESAGPEASSVLWSLFADQDVVVAMPDNEDRVADSAVLEGLVLRLGVDESVTRFLAAVSHSLSLCGVGVAGVRVNFARLPGDDVDRRHSAVERRLLRSETNHRAAIGRGESLLQFLAEQEGATLSPRLEWLDELTGVWRVADQASLGQLQVMLLMLRVHHLLRDDSGNAGHAFVVSDEFDRHLHPEATRKVLVELQRLLVDSERLTLVLSTHSVQPLGMAPLAGLQRIYAERLEGRITYSGSSNALRSTIDDVLGVSTLDALKLKRVHVLLEGLHDVMVVEDLLSHQIPEISDVNLVNGNGVNGWGGVFGNLLRFVDAPVLLVYDKRNDALEEAWDDVRRVIRERGQIPKWSKTPLARLLNDVSMRRKRGVQSGDHELQQVLKVLRKQVLDSGDTALAKRVHLRGLARDDIVDYLPIDSFPAALGWGRDWSSARERFRAKFGRLANGEKFKVEMGIDEKSVRRAILENADHVDRELAELVNVVRRLAAEQRHGEL